MSVEPQLFDFEEEKAFSRWMVEGGEAFGPRPVFPETDCWPPEAVFSPSYRFGGYSGQGMAHTNIWASEKHAWKRPARIPPGALVSPPFLIDRAYLTFRLAGMLHPRVRVTLRVSGSSGGAPIVAREMWGNNAFDLVRRGWDVSEFVGQQAQIALEAFAEEKCMLRIDDFRLTDVPPDEEAVFAPTHERDCPYLRPGVFTPFVSGDSAGTGWLHDAHLLRDERGKWHLFAVESKDREGWRPEAWDTLFHAQADSLHGPWSALAPAFVRDPARGEKWLRRTAMAHHDGRFYLFYNASGERHPGSEETQGPVGLHLAVSTDARSWQRIGGPGPLWSEPTDFSGPALFHREGQWHLLYAVPRSAKDPWPQGTLMARTSDDLMHWSAPFSVTGGGVTGSQGWALSEMRVFTASDGWWYLLGRGTVSQKGRTRFHFTEVWRSRDPLRWHFERDWIGMLNVWGGSPVVFDDNGAAQIVHCFFHARGAWIAPLRIVSREG